MRRLALVTLAIVPAIAAAQSGDSVPARLQTVMTMLDRRAIVRVRMQTGVWAAGPYRRSDDATLEVGPYIGFGEAPQRVPLAAMDSLWTRGTAAGALAWRGAVLGLVMTTAIAGATTACEGKYCATDLRNAMVGGTVAGAMLGGVVGLSTPRWQLQFGRTRSEVPRWAVMGDDTSAVSWGLWTAVAGLPYQVPIRLRMAGGPDIEGRFERATALGIQLRPHDWLQDGPPVEAPAVAIRGLFERGHRGKEMAILAGAIGFGLTMALSVDDTCGLLSGGEPTTSCGWRYVSRSVLGGIGGAWLGRLIGQQLPRWHRRF